MYSTDFSSTHALVSDHLDALRREAAQIREVARQPRNAKPPGLLARLRQAIARSRQPQARKTGAAPRSWGGRVQAHDNGNRPITGGNTDSGCSRFSWVLVFGIPDPALRPVARPDISLGTGQIRIPVDVTVGAF